MQFRFSIRTLIVTIAVCAIAVPATLIPGGYIFYLPILVIAVLGWLWVSLWRSLKRDPRRRTRYALAGLTVLLLGFAGFFIALADVAHSRFRTVRLATEQREAALSMLEPGRFREVALALRAELAALPEDQRMKSGLSPDLPDMIRELRPISVIATDDYISIQMTPDGSALIAYRSDSSITRVNCPVLITDLYYYQPY